MFILKKSAILILVCSFIMYSTSCSSLDYKISTENTITTTVSDTLKNNTKFNYTSLIDLYDKDKFSKSFTSVNWSESMVFTDLSLVKEYVSKCVDEYQESIGVIIPEGYPILNHDYYKTLGKGIWYMSGSQTTLSDGVHTANFIVYNPRYTTGAMVYNAYSTNNTSKLSYEQLQVYNIAKNFIDNTLDKSKSMVEQEKQIFDYICNSTTYYKDDNISANDYVRYKSASGVLLDGYSNCMGYSDAFYMLCSMAGMEIIYVSEESMKHAWNIITLDNKKYLVDVTYADTTYNFNDKNVISYMFFNAGLDVVNQCYTLSDDNPTRNITPLCDENYYFKNSKFNSYLANSNDIYNVILSHLSNGENYIEVMCQDNLPTNDETQFTENIIKMLSNDFNISNIGCVLQPLNNLGYVLVYSQ